MSIVVDSSRDSRRHGRTGDRHERFTGSPELSLAAVSDSEQAWSRDSRVKTK
ncbi:hypothetical protein E4U51_007766, partial [Claviceps purpurea]